MPTPTALYANAYQWALGAGFSDQDARRWAQLSAIRPAATKSEQSRIVDELDALLRKYRITQP